MSKLRGIKLHFMSFCLAVFAIFSTFFCFKLDSYAASDYSESFSYSGSTAESGLQFSTMVRELPDLIFDAPFEEDSYYEISVRTELNMDSSQALNFRIPYVSVGDYLFLLGENVHNSTVYNAISEKIFCISGKDLLAGFPVWFKCYMWNNNLDFNLEGNLKIQLLSYKKITSEVSDIYEQGYNQGFEEGEAFGYSDGYSSGFSDGENKGFSDGFEAGMDSVDTDSIYMEGYEAGREVAYVEGYDEGYVKGYAEALTVDTSNKTSLKAGNKQTYTVNKQLVLSELDEFNFNTFFPSLVVSEEYSDDSLYLEGGYGDSENWLNGEVDLEHVYSSFGYVNSVPEYVFTSSSEVYAYSVKFRHYFDSSTTYRNVIDHRFLFGEETDIYSGDSFLTNKTNRGTETYSLFWIVNDYSVRDFYLSNLLRICTGFGGSTYRYASVDGWYKVVVEVTPYSKFEYNAAVNAIEKQTVQMQQQFNDIKNGYDSSAGETMNQDFAASVTEYQTTSDSLFSSAQTGLESFTFVDFSSYPLLVTSMSFVTSLMTSVFRAMGGESGPAGIVLSVLFSVIIVSMAIGLYRFYSGKKDGDD